MKSAYYILLSLDEEDKNPVHRLSKKCNSTREALKYTFDCDANRMFFLRISTKKEAQKLDSRPCDIPVTGWTDVDGKEIKFSRMIDILGQLVK